MSRAVRGAAVAAIALAAMASACRRGGAPAARSTDAGAPSTSAAPPRGLARCEAGLARIQAHPGSRDDATSVLRRECADIPSDPACRDAWAESAGARGERAVEILVAGCAPAYCPRLAGRGLAVCAPAPLGGAERDRAWAELQQAIWELELGPHARTLGSRLMLAFTAAAEAWEDGEAEDAAAKR